MINRSLRAGAVICAMISVCLCLAACTTQKQTQSELPVSPEATIVSAAGSSAETASSSTGESSSAAASNKPDSSNAAANTSAAALASSSSKVTPAVSSTVSAAAATSAAVKPAGHCTVSVSCAEILDNMDKLAAGKEKYVSSGVFLSPTTVDFKEGASVFDVLLSIPSLSIDYKTSGFTTKTYYVRGINQIAEKDCGLLSGWVFYINGKSSTAGCSTYKVKNGDVIEWKYTCNGVQ